MPIASSQGSSTRCGAFKRRGEDLHARKAPCPGKPVERHRALDPPGPLQTSEMRLGGPEIAPVGTFPPALPSRMDRRVIRLASLESQFATVPLGAALDEWARRFGKSHTPIKSVPAKPAHHGDAGWEDRFSDPGRPKAASRRGEAPRGGASPLGILLKEESLSKLSQSESGFFPFWAKGWKSARWAIPRDSVCETTKAGCVKPRRHGGRNHDAAHSSGVTYPQAEGPKAA